ncbi:hypothetical protein B0H11DRAFT_1915403 [Mycena galericulata]|nr:hypothetical protein B0H11DRAFT_1915403 [Mycena galericulata]
MAATFSTSTHRIFKALPRTEIDNLAVPVPSTGRAPRGLRRPRRRHGSAHTAANRLWLALCCSMGRAAEHDQLCEGEANSAAWKFLYFSHTTDFYNENPPFRIDKLIKTHSQYHFRQTQDQQAEAEPSQMQGDLLDSECADWWMGYQCIVCGVEVRAMIYLDYVMEASFRKRFVDVGQGSTLKDHKRVVTFHDWNHWHGNHTFWLTPIALIKNSIAW